MKKNLPSFSNFLPELFDNLQRVSDTYLNTYNEHAAYVYFIAELFETTDEDRYGYTDGKSDGGIDFCISDSAAYTIAQCKCPELSTLSNSGNSPTFDQEALRELTSAIDMLLDKQGEYKVKKEIKQLRGDYQFDLQENNEKTSLTAILAVMGSLTESARTAFKSKKQEYFEQGVLLKLIEWEDVYHALHALETPADIDLKMQLSFGSEKDILAHSNYIYALCYAYDLYVAFREHEWNLFEWNVRYQIHKSPINKRIMNTLMRSRGRRNFHHYNNGLLVTCKGYKTDITRNRITFNGPQIINGCQTVRAICEAYESLSPSGQKQFREETLVQIKAIQSTDPEFIAELVVSTNDQNPMKPRNLKSNTSEQKSIQKSFRSLPEHWFFQRKDGEFKSLKASSSKVRWFRKSDYSSGTRRYRVLDNEDLAKTWLAFTGSSHRALRGGIRYFEDEPDGVYKRVFTSTPSPAFWSAFSDHSFVPNTELFEPRVPNVYQYLLAYGVGKFVDSMRISYKRNKDSAVMRGLKAGILKGDIEQNSILSTSREIDEYLSEDEEYSVNIMISNMREVIVELISYILVIKYGAIDAQTAKRIFEKFEADKSYSDSGFYCKDSITQDIYGKSVLGPVYEFFTDCMRQYFFKYQAEITATPRLKSYLAQRKTINKMRRLMLERDKAIVNYDAKWKIVGRTFIDSLPDL